MKALVGAFNQEKALVGAFSVLTNLRMELFQALLDTETSETVETCPGPMALGYTLNRSQGDHNNME